MTRCNVWAGESSELLGVWSGQAPALATLAFALPVQLLCPRSDALTRAGGGLAMSNALSSVFDSITDQLPELRESERAPSLAPLRPSPETLLRPPCSARWP